MGIFFSMSRVHPSPLEKEVTADEHCRSDWSASSYNEIFLSWWTWSHSEWLHPLSARHVDSLNYLMRMKMVQMVPHEPLRSQLNWTSIGDFWREVRQTSLSTTIKTLLARDIFWKNAISFLQDGSKDVSNLCQGALKLPWHLVQKLSTIWRCTMWVFVSLTCHQSGGLSK